MLRLHAGARIDRGASAARLPPPRRRHVLRKGRGGRRRAQRSSLASRRPRHGGVKRVRTPLSDRLQWPCPTCCRSTRSSFVDASSLNGWASPSRSTMGGCARSILHGPSPSRPERSWRPSRTRTSASLNTQSHTLTKAIRPQPVTPRRAISPCFAPLTHPTYPPP